MLRGHTTIVSLIPVLIRTEDVRRSVSGLVHVSSSHVFHTYVELGICGPIAETLTLALDLAHWCICEATTNSSSHDRQALEMARQVRVLLEQQANVGQSSGRYKPRSVRCC
jgi:hypothetical protein